MKNRIGPQAIIGTAGTSLFIQVCTVFQGILVARLLGAVGRGEYAAAILWPGVFAAIGIFGSNIAIARAAAKCEEDLPIFRSALVVGFCTSIVSALACYVAIPFLIPSAEMHLITSARIFTLFIIINHAKLNLIAVDKGSGNYRNYNLTRAILNPCYLTILAILWLVGVHEVQWFVFALLMANFVDLLFRLYLTFKHGSLVGKLYSPIGIMRQSVRFGLAGIAEPIYQHIDKVLLLWLLGAENLGIYVVALSASAAVGSLTNATGIVTFTMAAQADQAQGFERIAKIFRFSALMWLVFGSALAVVMPWVLPFVYGRDFISAVGPARLLILGAAFHGLSVQLEQGMRGQGRAFVGLEGRIMGLLVILTVGLISTRWLGLTGMCVAFIFGQLIFLLTIAHRTNRHYRLASGIIHYMPGQEDVRRIFRAIGRSSARLRGTRDI